MLRFLDLIFTSLWRAIRILVPDRDPPGFIQGSVDRVSLRRLRRGVRSLYCVQEFVAGSAIEIGDTVYLSDDGVVYPVDEIQDRKYHR